MAIATENKGIRRLSFDEVKEIHSAMSDLVIDIKDNVIKGNKNHFRHITGNCLIFSKLGKPLYDECKLNMVLPRLRDLKDYFNLLVDYDDYRESEFSKEGGYFPDVRDVGNEGIRNYIQKSKRLLEEKAKTQSKDL